MKTIADEKIQLHEKWKKVNADLKREFSISIDEARKRILREFKVPRAVFGKNKSMPCQPYLIRANEAAEIFIEQIRCATIDVENFGRSIARIAIAAALRIALRSYSRTNPRWLIPAHLFERFALAVWRALY